MRLSPAALSLIAILVTTMALAQPHRAKMRTLTDRPDRHVVIAKSDSDYISFPDVCLTRGGRLICVYRVADKHVATRARLEVRTSDDLGKTWSAPTVLSPDRGHCSRLTVLDDGEVLLIDDSAGPGGCTFRSKDEGRTWQGPFPTKLAHGIPDRPMRFGETSLITAGHRHIGAADNPWIGQRPAHQVLYRSDDLGQTWREWAPLATDPRLVLCEVSMLKMPDESIRAYLRENAAVQEPTYVMESRDQGVTWSHPEDTPMIGHRPCAGLLRSGKALVTYRDVGPNGGNRAWLGDPDSERFFAPTAFDLGKGATLTGDALVIENEDGDADAVMYCLRPITDPLYASARLDVDLVVERNEGSHCTVRLGCAWRIFPDRVEPQVQDIPAIPVDATKPHRYSFSFERGVAALSIDGEEKCRFDAFEHGVPRNRTVRPVRIGNDPAGLPLIGRFSFRGNAGRSVYRSISLSIDEPHYRRYRWTWTPADGLPNQYEADRILELENDRLSPPGDFGYSGWVQLPDGRVFCAAHYRGGHEYSYISGTWIEEGDFGGE